MTTTTYEPREGSKPAQVIAHLQAGKKGDSITTAEISALCHTEAKNVAPNMAAAVKHGLLKVVDNAQGLKAYALGDGTPPAAGTAKRPAGRRPGSKVKQQKARAPAQPKAAEPDDQAGDLSIAIWHDGDVVVSGMGVNEDGESVTFTRAQINRLFSTLTRPHTALATANHWPLLGVDKHAGDVNVG